jgi:hypothetical protein
MELRLLSLEGRYSSILASKHANGNKDSRVGIEILTATSLNSSIFRDIAPRSLCIPRFAVSLRHSGFLLGLIFSLDRLGPRVPPKQQFVIFSGLHFIIPQKTEHFNVSNSDTLSLQVMIGVRTEACSKDHSETLY